MGWNSTVAFSQAEKNTFSIQLVPSGTCFAPNLFVLTSAYNACLEGTALLSNCAVLASCRWTAFWVQLARMQQEVCSLGRAGPPLPHPHWRKEVQLPSLRETLHALRPPDKARPAPCQLPPQHAQEAKWEQLENRVCQWLQPLRCFKPNNQPRQFPIVLPALDVSTLPLIPNMEFWLCCTHGKNSVASPPPQSPTSPF